MICNVPTEGGIVNTVSIYNMGEAPIGARGLGGRKAVDQVELEDA